MSRKTKPLSKKTDTVQLDGPMIEAAVRGANHLAQMAKDVMPFLPVSMREGHVIVSSQATKDVAALLNALIAQKT